MAIEAFTIFMVILEQEELVGLAKSMEQLELVEQLQVARFILLELLMLVKKGLLILMVVLVSKALMQSKLAIAPIVICVDLYNHSIWWQLILFILLSHLIMNFDLIPYVL